jgi:hypothetical protein
MSDVRAGLGEDRERSTARAGAPGGKFVALVGDIHGSPTALHKAAAIPGVVAIVQLGDFGLPRHRIPRLPMPIYFLEGNHEMWLTVAPLMDANEVVECVPGCFYVPRGTVLTIGGKRYLCAGGADSVDKAYQQRHGHWCEREQWTIRNENRMLNTPRVDGDAHALAAAKHHRRALRCERPHAVFRIAEYVGLAGRGSGGACVAAPRMPATLLRGTCTAPSAMAPCAS